MTKDEDMSVLIDFGRMPDGIGHVVDSRNRMKRIYNVNDISKIVEWLYDRIGNIPDGTDVLLVGTLPTWMAMMVGIEMWRDMRIGRLLNGVPNSSQFVVFDRMVEVME